MNATPFPSVRVVPPPVGRGCAARNPARPVMSSRLLTLFIACLAAAANAGEFNAALSPGEAAPAWNSLPGVDQRPHSSADLPADQYILLAFTCNSCPVARDYEDRLIDFTRRHAGRVSVVAINVNTIPDDRLDKMQARAAERKFNFTYLYDETQQIARDYGASGTPEFFLLSPVLTAATPAALAGERSILYLGAFDDHADPAQVTRRYVEGALAAALEGKPPPVAETFAPGCRIRYARRRPE